LISSNAASFANHAAAGKRAGVFQISIKRKPSQRRSPIKPNHDFRLLQ
jgi:hypothetical protein